MERKTVDTHFLRFFLPTHITLQSRVYKYAFDSVGICLRFTGPTASHYIAISSGSMCRTKLVIVIILHEPWFMAVESLPDTRAAVRQLKRAFSRSKTLVRCHRLIDSYRLLLYYVWPRGYFSRSVRIPRSDDQTPSIPVGCKGCGFQIEVV